MTTDTKKYNLQDILHKLNTACLVPFLMSFQLNSRLFFNISLNLFLITLLAEFLVSRRYTSLTFLPRHKWYILLIAFWLLFPLYHCFETEQALYRHEMEKHLGFLLVGVMGLLNANRNLSLRFAAWSFIAAALFADIFVLCATNWHEVITGPQPLMVIYNVRYEYFGEHMRYNLCQNMALLSCFYLLAKDHRRGVRIVATAIAVFLIAFVFTSTGRIGVVTTLLLTAMFLIYRMRDKLYIVLPVCIIIFAVGGALMINAQRLQQYNRMTSTAIRQEPRLIIWDTAWEVFKQHPMGLGAGDGLAEFHKLAGQKEALLPDNLYLTHPHNLWLLYALYFGIIGLAGISLVFFWLPGLVDKTRRWYLIFALVPFFFEGLVDVFGSAIPPLLFLMPLWLIAECPDTDFV